MTILTTMTNVVSVFGPVMRAFAYSTFLMESALLAHTTITQSLVSVITQLCSVWARLCVCVDISSSVIKAGAWHRNYDCSQGGEADMRGLMFLKAFITEGVGWGRWSQELWILPSKTMTKQASITQHYATCSEVTSSMLAHFFSFLHAFLLLKITPLI